MAHRYWVLDGGLVWPCVSVCAGTLGKVEKAWLWPWGRWEEIIGINKGPDPLISSAPVADVGRIEQFYSFSLKSASQSKGKMTIGSVFKSLMQTIIKIGSAASVVLRKMCNVRSKFCNVLCTTQNAQWAMWNTKCAKRNVQRVIEKRNILATLLTSSDGRGDDSYRHHGSKQEKNQNEKQSKKGQNSSWMWRCVLRHLAECQVLFLSETSKIFEESRVRH